jgi:hypothetical protein
MRANLAAITAAFIGAAALAPQGAEAQGPPSWVQERVEQERARAERGAPQQARDRGQARGARGAGAQSCAPGHDVARGTPAGAVLDGVFGRGGPAAHARPGCRGQGQGKGQGARTQERTRDATGTIWDRVRDEAARAERAERRRGG